MNPSKRCILATSVLALLALPASASISWLGGTDTNWDTNDNWSSSLEPLATDDVIFPSPLPALGGTIALTTGEVARTLSFQDNYALSGGDLTLTVGDVTVDTGFAVTIDSSLLGSAPLTKLGGGELILFGINSYAGGTTISGGTLSIGDDLSLGVAAGGVTLNGGTLNAIISTTLGINRTITLNNVAGNAISAGTATNLFIDSKITGPGTLTKTGVGTVVLTNTLNDHTGGTVVSAGTLSLGADQVLTDGGALTVNGGTFDVSFFNETVGVVTLTGGNLAGSVGALTASSYDLQAGTSTANLTGGGSFTKTGTGTVILGGNNVFNPGSTIQAGILQANSSGALGTSVVEVTGGTLAIGAAGIATPIKLNGGVLASTGASRNLDSAVEIAGNSSLTTIDPIAGTNVDLNIFGVISGNGTATVTSTPANSTTQNKVRIQGIVTPGTFTGTIKVEPNAVFQIRGTADTTFNPLGSGATIELNTGLATATVGGRFELITNFNTDFGNPVKVTADSSIVVGATGTNAATNRTLSLGTLAIGSNQLNTNILNTTGYVLAFNGLTTLSGSAVFDVVTIALSLNGVTDGGGGFGLTKQNAGVMTLAGPGTYSGTTNMNAGTLILGTSTSLGTGPVVFNAGILTTNANLSGANRVTNPITLGVTSALSFAGGGPGTGTLELDSNLDFLGISRSIAGAPTGGLILNGVLSNDGGLGLTKTSANPVTFAGSSSNTYTGLTTLSAGPGVVTLAKTGGATAIQGDITMSSTAVLTLGGNNQIADTSNLTLGATTNAFNVGTFTETIATLNSRGTVTVGAGGALTITGTTTTPAASIINVTRSDSSAGKVVFGGDITTTSTLALGTTGTGTNVGTFDLNGANRTLTAGGTVTVTASIANGTLTKAGAGTLALNNTTGGSALNADLIVTAGTVSLSANDQIEDTRSLTMQATGIFSLNGKIETFKSLSLSDTGSASTTANGNLTLTNTLTINTTGAAASLTLTSPSTVTVSGAQITALATGSTGAILLGANGPVFNLGAGGLLINSPATATGTTNVVYFNSTTTGTRAQFNLGGDVTFVGSGANANLVRIVADTTNATRGLVSLNSASRIFNIGDGAAPVDFGIAVEIQNGTETSSLVKTGLGTLGLSVASTYTGGTTIREGAISVSASNTALGLATNTLTLGHTSGVAGASLVVTDGRTLAYPIVVASGSTGNTLSLNSTSSAAVILSGAVTVNHPLLVTTAGSTLTLSGGLTLGADLTTSTGTSTITFGTTAITGTGNLFFGSTSTGSTILSVANTFVGNTNLQSGDLALGNKDALGPVGTNTLNVTGGLLRASAALTGASAVLNNITITSGGLNLGGTNSFDLGGLISGGTTGLIKSNTSTVTLTNASNSFAGGITINGGGIAASADAPLGAAAGGITFNGGTFTYGASFAVDPARTFTFSGAGTLNTSTFNVTLANKLTGAGSFTKSGGAIPDVPSAAGATLLTSSTGVVTLANNNNDFTGGITLSGGLLSISNSGQLGSGTAAINLTGGGMYFTDNATVTRDLTVTSNYTTGNRGPLGVALGKTVEFTGVISGAGGLRFDNGSAQSGNIAAGSLMPPSGTVIFSGSGNNGAGTFGVSSFGIVSIRNGVTIGSDNPALGNVLVQGGAVLELGAFDMVRTLGTGLNQFSFAGTSYGGGFAAYGADRVVALGGLAAPTALIWGSTSTFFGASARNLVLGSPTATHLVDWRNDINLNSSSTNLTRVILAMDGPAAVEGRISGMLTRTGSGTVTLAIEGPGAVELTNGNNGSTGTAWTTIVRGGTLLLGANATGTAGNTVLSTATGAIQIGDTAAVNAFGTNGNAALLINGNFTVSRLLTVNTGNASLATFGGYADANSTFSGNVTLGKSARLTSASLGANKVLVSSVVSGAGGLNKIGAGIAELSGVNTFTGGLTVSEGTLVLSNNNTFTGGATISGGKLLANNLTGSATGTNAVTVGALGTLGGTGAVTGAVTVNGTLAPGASPGLLSTGALSFGSGSTFALDLTSNVPVTGYDQVSVTGAVTLAGGALQLAVTFDPADETDIFYVILNDGAEAVSGTFAGLAEGGFIATPAQNYVITYQANWTGTQAGSSFTGGNDIALLAVPEPGSALLLLGGLALLTGRRRQSAGR